MIKIEEDHQQSQPWAAASAEAAPNINPAAANKTTEGLGLVLQRSPDLFGVGNSCGRKALVAASKTMNRAVRRAIVMHFAALHSRYPMLQLRLNPQYII